MRFSLLNSDVGPLSWKEWDHKMESKGFTESRFERSEGVSHTAMGKTAQWTGSSAKALGSVWYLRGITREPGQWTRQNRGSWAVTRGQIQNASQIGWPGLTLGARRFRRWKCAVNNHAEIIGIDGECSGHIDLNDLPMCDSLPGLWFFIWSEVQNYLTVLHRKMTCSDLHFNCSQEKKRYVFSTKQCFSTQYELFNYSLQ